MDDVRPDDVPGTTAFNEALADAEFDRRIDALVDAGPGCFDYGPQFGEDDD